MLYSPGKGVWKIIVSDAKDLNLPIQVRNCNGAYTGKLNPEVTHESCIIRAHSSVKPDLPLTLPHLPSEIFQLLGLPVWVLDLVHLLEPISAGNNLLSEWTNREETAIWSWVGKIWCQHSVARRSLVQYVQLLTCRAEWRTRFRQEKAKRKTRRALEQQRGDLTHWRARKMSWISPSTCSSSGLMGTSLAIDSLLSLGLNPLLDLRLRLAWSAQFKGQHLLLSSCSPRHCDGGEEGGGWS